MDIPVGHDHASKPHQNLNPNASPFGLFSSALPSSSHQLSLGLTQSIRTRLNFVDEVEWRKFSARRLEFIDAYKLSDKPASEQEHQLAIVAQALRNEYCFDESYHDDFVKLVRAGIQSVRRNRKRVSKRSKPVASLAESPTPVASSPSPSSYHNTHSYHPYSPKLRRSPLPTIPHFDITDHAPGPKSTNEQSRLSINSLLSRSAATPPLSVTSNRAITSRSASPSLNKIAHGNARAPTPVTLPSLSELSINAVPPHKPLFRPDLHLPQFSIILSSLRNELSPYQMTLLNLPTSELISASLLSVATTFAIEECQLTSPKVVSFIHSQITSDDTIEYICHALEFNSVLEFKCALAEHMRRNDLDTSIALLLSLFKAILMHESSVEIEAMAGNLDAHSIPTTSTTGMMNKYLASAPPDSVATNDLREQQKPLQPHFQAPTSCQPSHRESNEDSADRVMRMRPVILRFNKQKFDLTFATDNNNTPPTLTEVLEDGRKAFNILGNRDLQVRNVNRRGMILTSNADVEDAFKDARVDLELFVPSPEPVKKSSPVQGPRKPKFQELL